MRQFYNIYMKTNGRWQNKYTEYFIHNKRNTMEHQNKQNRLLSYKQSIRVYFKSMYNKAAKFL